MSAMNISLIIILVKVLIYFKTNSKFKTVQQNNIYCYNLTVNEIANYLKILCKVQSTLSKNKRSTFFLYK